MLQVRGDPGQGSMSDNEEYEYQPTGREELREPTTGRIKPVTLDTYDENDDDDENENDAYDDRNTYDRWYS